MVRSKASFLKRGTKTLDTRRLKLLMDRVTAGAGELVSSDRSTTHPIPQVKHPVALNHYVRFLQQVLCVDRPEVALAGP